MYSEEVRREKRGSRAELAVLAVVEFMVGQQNLARMEAGRNFLIGRTIHILLTSWLVLRLLPK